MTIYIFDVMMMYNNILLWPHAVKIVFDPYSFVIIAAKR